MNTNPKRPKTDHAAAVAYAARGWSGYKSREAWRESLLKKMQEREKTLGQTPKPGVS
jgi:hypothetical protein